MSKKIFITGIAGFIGFHTALSLHQKGFEVIGIDNFNDYYSPILKLERANVLKKLSITIKNIDLLDRPNLEALIKSFNPAHLIHLAAQAGVRYSIENPQAYVQANIEGFLNILEICKNIPALQLIYASSSSVYGNNKKIPFSITDPVDNQASFYGVTKKTNELMAQTYHHLYNIPTIGLRFFTVYGPWGRPDMAYFSFTKAILEDRPINIYNNGEMSRDFTYVDDIVQGVTACLTCNQPHAVFNLGNHQPEKLMTLIDLLEKKLGKKANKIMLPMQPGDVISTYADIKESIEILNFMPKTPLKEGIEKFVDWYLSYPQQSSL